MNLRQAAEMAFTELCNQRDAHYTKDIPTELAQAIQILRHALAQQEQEWVGLTDEEIESELTKEFGQWWSRHVSVCRAIEAKLKEKNNG